MAKSDTDLEHIDVSKAQQNLRKAEWTEDKEIIAFDTETIEGDIFMISTSSKDKDFVYEKNGEIFEPQEIFDKITQKYFRNTLNVWFNIGFDAEVILKVLPEYELTILQITNSVEWNNYRITYLPNKYLRIETGINNGNNDGRYDNYYEFFDVAQLFRNNLENAVNEWLDESKKDEAFETQLFGTLASEQLSKVVKESNKLSFEDLEVDKGDSWTVKNAKNYIQDHYSEIQEYAKYDAKLTRQLTEELVNIAEDIDIPCGKPFSTGYLAENYLKNRLNSKPGWSLNNMQKMAWEAFAGGRFEVFRRGKVGKVVGPDINSAYPYIMSQLPNPSTLDWDCYKVNIPSIQEVKETDYGFVRAKVTTNKDKNIQPFSYKIDGIVKYPILKDTTTTILKDTFIWALENDYIEDYTIEKCCIGIDHNAQYPFKFMPDLYNQRKIWEDNEKIRRAWLLKIILNSMFGKTAQTQYNIELIEELNLDDIPEGVEVSSGPRNEYPHKKYLESGSLFNPFLASYITGLTRLELHKQVEKYGLTDNVILFATDSIMVESKAYYNSNFDELLSDDSIDYKGQLGSWDFDYEGKGFVIGSGVYEVELKDSNKIKMATRGFREMRIDSLQESAKQAGKGGIEIKHNRPITLGEAMHQKKLGNEDIGKFFEGKRELRPGFDQKRIWENDDPSWKNLLEGTEYSKPIEFSE